MGLLQRVQYVIGLGQPLDEFEDGMAWAEPDPPLDAPYADPSPWQSTNVVGLWGAGIGQSAIILLKPQSFDEIPQAVGELRQRKSIILDLTLVEVEVAQRCADYVAGATYALDGHHESLGDRIFLFTPSSVQIHHGTTGAGDRPTAPPDLAHARPSALPPALKVSTDSPLSPR